MEINRIKDIEYMVKVLEAFYSVNFKSYKSFYRINDDYIEVVRVLLMKMDYIRILFNQ